jgi:hypothetical protein
MRTVSIVALIAVVSSISFVVWLNAKLDSLWEPSLEEVARIASPSGKLEAVLIETNGGATTAFGYLIYVVKTGSKPPKTEKAPADFYRPAGNGSRYGVNLRWKNDALLYADYLSATLAHNSGHAAVYGFEPVTIELRSGIVDPSMPSSEMLHNIVHLAGSLDVGFDQSGRNR